MPLLEVSRLSVEFNTMRGVLRAVDRIDFHVDEGEVLGIVGESGCGKSMTSLAVMGLLPKNAKIGADRLVFHQKNLLELGERDYQDVRGGEMAMIFQDPMTSLNPSFTVGFQIFEAIQAHQPCTKAEIEDRAVRLLDQVGIPDPRRRLAAYPHQLSGGMSQRVMIAMAIACRPKLLIADEPTTALDVTIQAQILDLLRELQHEYRMALMLITHDIGVVSEMADRLMVMYAGQVVETGSARNVIDRPQHPYTSGLLQCLPQVHLEEEEHRGTLPTIPGLVPDLVARPQGCQMHPRCGFVKEKCRQGEPELQKSNGTQVKCYYPLSQGGASL